MLATMILGLSGARAAGSAQAAGPHVESVYQNGNNVVVTDYIPDNSPGFSHVQTRWSGPATNTPNEHQQKFMLGFGRRFKYTIPNIQSNRGYVFKVQGCAGNWTAWNENKMSAEAERTSGNAPRRETPAMIGLVPAFIAELSELGVRSIADAIHPAASKVVGFFKGVWKRYREKKNRRDQKAEVERIARMTAAEMIAEVRPQLAAAFPGNANLQQEGELYFAQMPGAVRGSLKRKDDPTGRSAPDDLDLDKPEKLAVLYPAAAPQHRPGDDLPRRKGVWKLLDLLGAGGFGEVWRDHPWILFQFVEGGTLEDAMHELSAVAVPDRWRCWRSWPARCRRCTRSSRRWSTGI